MKKSIFIATGIYPPELGGPAEYASNLARVWKEEGFKVSVGVFSKWNFLFTGFRHFVYLCAILPKVFFSDYILILDTYSSALPTVILGKIFRKKMVLRTGGDFLWESYVERTGDLVLLKDFYSTRQKKLSKKERMIFRLTKFVLKNVNQIVWSTEWQKEIFMSPYSLQNQKHSIVENYFGPKQSSETPSGKNFVGATRKLKWKNIDLLKNVFNQESVKNSGSFLDLEPLPHDLFQKKIASSYAVIIVSLGDISPNTVIDAITHSVPFIVTKETGLYNRIKDVALFVDPQNEEDITEKILWLASPENYTLQKKKLESWNFVHDWNTIALEYQNIFKTI